MNKDQKIRFLKEFNNTFYNIDDISIVELDKMIDYLDLFNRIFGINEYLALKYKYLRESKIDEICGKQGIISK